MLNPNKIRMRGDTIILVAHGPQDFNTVDKSYKSIRSKIRKLRIQKKPVYILADLTDSRALDPGARSVVKEFFKLDFDKFAYFGKGSGVHNIILYLAGTHNRSRVRHFSTKKQALRWLETDHQPLVSLSEPSARTSRLLVMLVLVLGLAVSLMMFARLNRNADLISQRQADHAAQASADAVSSKMDAYLTTLEGFKAFFAADTSITQKDFHDYFASLQIDKRYPGITGIGYIREVKESDRQGFVEHMRNDTSYPGTTLPDFDIQNPKSQPVYYPIVLIEPMPVQQRTFGFDLSTVPNRVETINKARDTGRPAASEQFEMMKGGKPTGEKGFFLTIPVDNGPGGPGPGYINAIFGYNDLFRHTDQFQQVPIEITNKGTVIYRSNTIQPGATEIATAVIDIADKRWQLRLYGDSRFGLSSVERLSPYMALASGLALTTLVAFTLSNLLRSRQAAFNLAQYITDDLRIAEHKHDLMIDSIKDYAIYMLDKEGRVVSWNSGAALLKGYRGSDVIGKNFSMFYRKAERRNARKFLNKAEKEGRAETNGWRVRKDKSEFWAHVTLSAVRDENGQLIGFTKVTQDLTRQRQLEEERDSFIAVATHELRTPLTSLKAYAQILQRRFTKSGDQKSADMLHKMEAQVGRLTSLVGDLLDVSKLDTGHLEYEMAPFDLDEVVKTIMEELSWTTSDHHLRISGKIGTPIVGDRYRINQVITNLVENAIKYSPEGKSIEIMLRTAKKFAEVRVSDHGPGISQTDQEHIFDRFYRTASSKGSAGFGLGLYISSEIAKHHDGEITITSKPGAGSTFTLRLPLDGPKA